jgi:hypothetical protein
MIYRPDSISRIWKSLSHEQLNVIKTSMGHPVKSINVHGNITIDIFQPTPETFGAVMMCEDSEVDSFFSNKPTVAEFVKRWKSQPMDVMLSSDGNFDMDVVEGIWSEFSSDWELTPRNVKLLKTVILPLIKENQIPKAIGIWKTNNHGDFNRKSSKEFIEALKSKEHTICPN